MYYVRLARTTHSPCATIFIVQLIISLFSVVLFIY